MITYFADRQLNILGMASTTLPKSFEIKDDLKIEDIATGLSSFECYIHYTKESRDRVKQCVIAGNYILRNHEEENEFYTIIETEEDTKEMYFYLYAEDAGLDLLNEETGPLKSTEAHPIAFYIERYAKDSGFEIGINEVPTLQRKLSWDGESTVTERLQSVARNFDAELSYSFEIKGLEVVRKLINVHKKRGSETNVMLRDGIELDGIKVKKSISGLATALRCEGGTPEGKDKPITLKGYSHDDGDFYVSGTTLYCRSAVEKWSRYRWNKEPNQLANGKGHIIKRFSYDTTSQSELCNRAISKLKKIKDPAVNFEAEVIRLPDTLKIGDRAYLVSESAEIYVKTRILKLETSISDNKKTVTFGESALEDSTVHGMISEGIEEQERQRDSGLIDLTLNSANFKFGGTVDKNYHAFYRKVGKQVIISFAVLTAKAMDLSSARTIASLPPEIVPTAEFDNFAFNSGGRYYVTVSPRGNLTLNGTGRIDSGQIVRGSISYFI